MNVFYLVYYIHFPPSSMLSYDLVTSFGDYFMPAVTFSLQLKCSLQNVPSRTSFHLASLCCQPVKINRKENNEVRKLTSWCVTLTLSFSNCLLIVLASGGLNGEREKRYQYTPLLYLTLLKSSMVFSSHPTRTCHACFLRSFLMLRKSPQCLV